MSENKTLADSDVLADQLCDLFAESGDLSNPQGGGLLKGTARLVEAGLTLSQIKRAIIAGATSDDPQQEWDKIAEEHNAPILAKQQADEFSAMRQRELQIVANRYHVTPEIVEQCLRYEQFYHDLGNQLRPFFRRR